MRLEKKKLLGWIGMHRMQNYTFRIRATVNVFCVRLGDFCSGPWLLNFKDLVVG